VAWTAARLAEHAKTHGLDEVRVVLHGREPLLAGPDRNRRCTHMAGRSARARNGTQASGTSRSRAYSTICWVPPRPLAGCPSQRAISASQRSTTRRPAHS
jgi:hypothetical protein